ncbi:glyceraldehyde-3-phosphate dehydrogenase-like [Pongo abelii]|uniref:glyceraldehyde-3-phosphate dehydrogenase-like n=1 Tax=Pongo abelii TaxID=9601 RepID=UPI0023E8F546|nr:glyceraldehyde-3-phosphate dehydrogenase-like [Pongo abelii]XP_054376437.1 glyceraldehyde-3-phosphate dehydrogenase-like [Pongo abelii]
MRIIKENQQCHLYHQLSSPLAKVIQDNLGNHGGTHDHTHDHCLLTQKTINAPSGKLWCDGHGALQNIIPTSTGAAKAVGKVIPELNKKLTGMAFHVPTANMLVRDLTCHLEKPAKYDDTKKVVKQVSEGLLKDILGYTEHHVVSYINSDTHSSTFDAEAAIALNDYFVKLMSWFYSAVSYSNRVVDFADHMASEESEPQTMNTSKSTRGRERPSAAREFLPHSVLHHTENLPSSQFPCRPPEEGGAQVSYLVMCHQ